MADDDGDGPALPPSDHKHGVPEDGLECMATMEDITAEDGNYCEYQTEPSGSWHACKYAADTVRRLLRTQFDEYAAGVRKADCHAELRRRLGPGPPIWIADKHAMPLPEGDTHVCRVWYADTGHEYSAKLKGALEGAERQALWDELAAFLGPPEEAKEGEGEAKEGEEGGKKDGE